MTKEELLKIAQRIGSNPIAKSAKLPEGSYAIQKTNDLYNVVAELAGKWQPIEITKLNTLTAGCRWIIFNSVLNHKTGKPVTALVNLDFPEIALKTNLLMTVDSKGYTNVDTKHLKASEVKAYKSEIIEAIAE